MKNWIYPFMVIIAASNYGILSTITKVAMGNGFLQLKPSLANILSGLH